MVKARFWGVPGVVSDPSSVRDWNRNCSSVISPTADGAGAPVGD